MYISQSLLKRLNECRLTGAILFRPPTAGRDELIRFIEDGGFRVSKQTRFLFQAYKQRVCPPLTWEPTKMGNDGELSHDKLQAELFKWAWNTYPQIHYCIFAVMNELPRAKGESSFDHMKRIQAARAVGLVPGVLDIMFYWDGILHVLDIKVGKDTLGEKQFKFIAAIKKHGGLAYEVPSLDDGKRIIKGIIECPKIGIDDTLPRFMRGNESENSRNSM